MFAGVLKRLADIISRARTAFLLTLSPKSESYIMDFFFLKNRLATQVTAIMVKHPHVKKNVQVECMIHDTHGCKQGRG